MKAGGLASILAALALSATTARAEGGAVLDDLRDGNGRFVAGVPARRATPRSLQVRSAPRVVVLACSDARIPVLRALDQPAGTVSVVRTPGLRLDAETVDALDLTLTQSSVRALVVLSHGAGQGAVASTRGVLARLLRASVELRAQVGAGRLALEGGVYALDTGRISWLGPHPQQERLVEVVRGSKSPPKGPVCCAIGVREAPQGATPPRAWLDAGWTRFSERAVAARWTLSARREAARERRPRVVVVLCSEVPLAAEDLFDADPGAIETVRVGAAVPSDVQRLALARLCRGQVSGLVVLGHTNCEVAAQALKGSSRPGLASAFAEHLLQALNVDAAPRADVAQRLVAAAARELRERSTPEFENRLREGQFPLLAGVLDVGRPAITWLDLGRPSRAAPVAPTAQAVDASAAAEPAPDRLEVHLPVSRRGALVGGAALGLGLVVVVVGGLVRRRRRRRRTRQAETASLTRPAAEAPAPRQPVEASTPSPAPDPTPPTPPTGQTDDQLWATLVSLETGGDDGDMWETLISADPLAGEVPPAPPAAPLPEEEEETARVPAEEVRAPGAPTAEPEPEPEPDADSDFDAEEEGEEESLQETEEEAMMRIWLEETGEAVA